MIAGVKDAARELQIFRTGFVVWTQQYFQHLEFRFLKLLNAA